MAKIKETAKITRENFVRLLTLLTPELQFILGGRGFTLFDIDPETWCGFPQTVRNEDNFTGDFILIDQAPLAIFQGIEVQPVVEAGKVADSQPAVLQAQRSPGGTGPGSG